VQVTAPQPTRQQILEAQLRRAARRIADAQLALVVKRLHEPNPVVAYLQEHPEQLNRQVRP
jgi:hypothetical protein